MHYKNNWFSWYYDGVEKCHKQRLTSKFSIDIKKTICKPVKSYYEELFDNATLIRDTLVGPLDLLFSGGIDSEVILRVYRDLKIPINVYIFKYENNYNHREYNQAIKICEALNVKYNVIDFNVQKFFENDAYDIWSKCFANSSGWLPHMKMTEYLDGIPIFGSGDPYWRKQDNGTWMFEIDEGAKFWTTYHVAVGREAICDWYEYSPEIIIAHMNLPKIDNLINNRIPGKLSSFSHKSIIHKDYWPDIDIRQKLVGFEGEAPPSPNSKPEFMLAFEKEFIKGKTEAVTVRYTAEQLRSIL